VRKREREILLGGKEDGGIRAAEPIALETSVNLTQHDARIIRKGEGICRRASLFDQSMAPIWAPTGQATSALTRTLTSASTRAMISWTCIEESTSCSYTISGAMMVSFISSLILWCVESKTPGIEKSDV
jgi:hypothetical protein